MSSGSGSRAGSAPTSPEPPPRPSPSGRRRHRRSRRAEAADAPRISSAACSSVTQRSLFFRREDASAREVPLLDGIHVGDQGLHRSGGPATVELPDSRSSSTPTRAATVIALARLPNSLHPKPQKFARIGRCSSVTRASRKTPATTPGFSGTTLAKATFGDLGIKAHTIRPTSGPPSSRRRQTRTSTASKTPGIRASAARASSPLAGTRTQDRAS